jgi:hypothetical protein
MNQSSLRLAGTLAMALAVAPACGGDPPPQRTPPPDAKRVDYSKAGRISGRIGIEGAVPENPLAKISSDPVCARENASGLSLENLVAEDGGLNNVFVYVKEGLGAYYFESPAEPVKLDQQGCRYKPHVFGAQIRQPIEIANSDATVHNVSAVTSVNRGFNFTQAMKGLKNTTSFAAPEVMVRFKCDVHEWMSAYAGILSHPYFAVSANGGRFEMKDVPAGTYTVEAWHEKLGRQTQSVTLADNDSKDVTFTFRAGTGD